MKTKALISFVFAYANCWFSQETAHVLRYFLGADIGCGGEVQDIPMSYTSETVQRSYVSGKI